MILHISNDFNHTKVHKELYSELDQLGVDQSIFIPVRNEMFVNRNHFSFQQKDSKFYYSAKLKNYHRFFFRSKINYLYDSLVKQVQVLDIKLVHATTLFSDGALALKLFRNYKIPYIVAVRSTDINYFFKYRKDLSSLGRQILLNASRIIFISEASKKLFLKLNSIEKILPSLENKIIKFNNGVDDFWIDNKQPYTHIQDEGEKVNFLFIGDFIKRKNCVRLIEAISKVRDSNKIDIDLFLVGRPGDQSQEVETKVQQNKWIHFYGEIKEKKELKLIFDRAHFFTMISHIETFGLVYIEALTQGKPVLFTEGQGIDYLFDFNVGEKVNSTNSKDIEDKIQKLINRNYGDINLIDFEEFRWGNIANKYCELYKLIIND